MFGLLLHFQLARAEIYKWVDEKGTVHFTQDPSTIPEKYHDKTESRTTEEDSMSIEERVKAKQRDEAEIRKRINRENNEYLPRGQEDRSRKIQKEAPRAEDAPSTPSPGYVPFEKFKYITKGMTEAEVLGRLGSPTREEEGEVKSRGTVSGGSVSGFVQPGGHFSGSVSDSSYRGETFVVKKYYYIGDRSRGEQTRIIIFEKGRVVDYKTIP